MRTRTYRAYGLTLASDTELPELLPGPPVAAPDLEIATDPEAARQWAAHATVADGSDFAAAPGGGQVMRIAGVCDYWVRDGRRIGYAPAAGADPASVRLYLLGSAMGMALHQRGLLVMHGATVRRGSRATIFTGDSGEGKSTLAAHLGRRGLPILGDDTMPLWPRAGQDGARRFEACPGSRVFKLWSDAIEVLGVPGSDLQSVGEQLDKYFVANPATAADVPCLVDELILLEASWDGTPPCLESISGLDALRVIAQNTYRPEYVPLLGAEDRHFRLCAEFAAGVRVYRLRRPWDLGRIGEVEALLHDHWAAGADAAAARG